MYRKSAFLIFVSLLSTADFAQSDDTTGAHLESGEYFVAQTWSQETDFRRPYHVHVPKHDPNEQLPVFMFLHGNGGDARGAMKGTLRRLSKLSTRCIMVFPNGYLRSWNIVSERSKADDRGFIEAIVKNLAAYANVEGDNFTIMGNSNGAALVNQLAIESRLPQIRNYISAVSPLNVYQYHGNSFRSRGSDNSYRSVAKPMMGKHLMNISGTEDRLVPYRGGPSKVIPAKGGKLAFVDAERSTFLWAKQMGYEGSQLRTPTRQRGNLEFFSYLNGAVVHVKVNGEGHGAAGAVSEEALLKFLEMQPGPNKQ